MAERAKLIRGSIAGHLVKQTTPAVLGVAALMTVGIIDAYFIGQLGQAELAAISFIFPIITALSSLGVGVMVGVNSVVSRALGEGDDEKVLGRANLGMVFALACGLVVGLALFALRQPLFRLMQADAEILPLIDTYMRPFALGFPLLLAMMGINGVLRGQGAAKSNTGVLLAFAATNWVLDPILISGAFSIPGFGVAGAAYASIGGWLVGLVVGFILLGRGEIPWQPSILLNRRWGPGIAAIGRVAGPAAFTNSINPAGLAILTALLASEGQAAVAAFGAGGRIQAFAVVPLLALSGSIGAIVGQNWGAGMADRARLALLQATGFAVAYGLAAALVLYAFCFWFASQFSDDPQVVAATVRYLEISVWGYAGFGVLITVNGALNAVDRANNAMVLSLSRVLLVMVPIAWLLRAAWGTDAIYAGELAANMLGGLAAALMAWWIFRQRPEADDG